MGPAGATSWPLGRSGPSERPGGTEMLTAEQRKANLRLALILASLAAVFLLGFVAKILWLSAG